MGLRRRRRDRAAGVEVGQRLYGYLPIASHLVVRPQRVDDRGIRDATEHRQALPDHLSAQLVVDLVVGVTHQDSCPAGTLAGARPSVFLAPDRMRKRTADWGREGLDDRFSAAWRSFVPAVESWVDVTVGHGPQALREVWLDVLQGRSAPRTGHVLQL